MAQLAGGGLQLPRRVGRGRQDRPIQHIGRRAEAPAQGREGLGIERLGQGVEPLGRPFGRVAEGANLFEIDPGPAEERGRRLGGRPEPIRGRSQPRAPEVNHLIADHPDLGAARLGGLTGRLEAPVQFLATWQ